MNISIKDIDRDNFLVHEHEIAGETCYLVQPQHIGCSWNAENKIFRSSIWNSKGEPVSLSFPKFVNWGEKPDLFPVPQSLDGCELMEKMDGSTLIVSRYKGQLIIRTRGTSDATKLNNGFEIEILKQKYPKVFDFSGLPDTHNFSYVYEWVSSVNKIVVAYNDCPDIFLTACINHNDYSFLSQSELDNIADNMDVKRPNRYKFNTIQEMLKAVEVFKGVEGICLYSKDGQEIHKIKGLEYLALHRFKSNATLENTVDLYFELNRPSYSEFEKQLVEKFDFECFKMVQGYASNICDAMKEVQNIINGFKTFAEKVKGLSRKDAAVLVMQAYGETNRASFVFNIIDGKILDNDKVKKLLWQVLKK